MTATAPEPERLAPDRSGARPAPDVEPGVPDVGPGVVDALGSAVAELLAAPDAAGVAAAAVSAALRVLPSARSAGIAVRDAAGTLALLASTGDDVVAVGELQAKTGEGPGVDALESGAAVVVPDLGGYRERWPRLAARASFLDVHSLVAVPLPTAPNRLAAVLTVHSPERSAFGAGEVRAARLLAQHTALALVAAQERHGLRRALESRDLIGQAKGVLMHAHGITAEEAFARLTDSSQSTNLKLVAVAEWVVANLARGA